MERACEGGENRGLNETIKPTASFKFSSLTSPDVNHTVSSWCSITRHMWHPAQWNLHGTWVYFALSKHAFTAQLKKAATTPLISFNRFNSRYNGHTTQPKWSMLPTLLLRTYLTKNVLPQVRKMNLNHFLQRKVGSSSMPPLLEPQPSS